MSKHTPGEWTLNLEAWLPTISVGRVGYITVNTGSANVANAKLVAAAPKLLAALKECVKYLDSGDYPENSIQRELWEEAQEAIAHSEGRI